VIKEIQESKNLDKMQLAEITMKLQSKIIINVSVGTAYADTKLDYEGPNGVESLFLPNYLDRMITDGCMRIFSVTNILFPLFVWSTWSPSDWRYARNTARFRKEIQKIIDERRSGKTGSYE